MIAQQVAQRYAKALFLFVDTNDRLEIFLNQLLNLVDLSKKIPEINSLLISPLIGKKEKRDLLKKVCEKKIDPQLLRFLLFLLEKNRLKYLPEITLEFQKKLMKKLGVINVSVATTIPFDADKKEKLKTKLEKSSGKKINLQEKIDPSLKGGGQLKYENYILDNSVKSKLERLKLHLQSHNL